MPSPLGARCRSPLGGLYRSPLGALACPDVGCPDALELTLAGVDAGVCNVCRSGQGQSELLKTLSVDGTYSLDSPVLLGSQCRYTKSIAGSWATSDFWLSSSTCAGAPTVSDHEYDVLKLSVFVNLSDKTIEIINAEILGDFPNSGGGFIIRNLFHFSPAPSQEYGDEIANKNTTCSTNTFFGNVGSTDGTAVLELPIP